MLGRIQYNKYKNPIFNIRSNILQYQIAVLICPIGLYNLPPYNISTTVQKPKPKTKSLPTKNKQQNQNVVNRLPLLLRSQKLQAQQILHKYTNKVLDSPQTMLHQLTYQNKCLLPATSQTVRDPDKVYGSVVRNWLESSIARLLASERDDF